jgi:hypothetical protein
MKRFAPKGIWCARLKITIQNPNKAAGEPKSTKKASMVLFVVANWRDQKDKNRVFDHNCYKYCQSQKYGALSEIDLNLFVKKKPST